MRYNLILNPGSTSTKLALFQGKECSFLETIRHTEEELSRFETVAAQEGFRTEVILSTLEENGYRQEDVGGIISIGGLIRPQEGGVYRINQAMVDDLLQARYYEHAANLGALIAWRMSRRLGIDAFIADAITVDEMAEVARLSGLPELPRQGRSHTLNQKSTARQAAAMLQKSYEEARLVVAHLGGGISIAAHMNGKIVDVTMARGEGAFSIDRSGGLNAYELVKLCFSGAFTKEEMLQKLNGAGGVVAYLGTRDLQEVERLCREGNLQAQSVFESLTYQIAKEIGAMAAALGHRPDAIVLTGGMAHSQALTEAIQNRVRFIAETIVMPGEREMEALAEYLDSVQKGSQQVLEYLAEG